MTEPYDATYYTASDEEFFVGTIALLNSLRITRNVGNLIVFDCGLRDAQRRLLEQQADTIAVPAEVAAYPAFVKPFLSQLDPSGVAVWIDSDIIVTRSLDDVVRSAAAGSICMFATSPNDRDRWFADWHSTLGLKTPLRRERYMNAGFIALSTDRWRDLLVRWWDVCKRVPREQYFSRSPGNHPFWTGEQDALNALLMSEVPPESLLELPEDEAVFTGDLHRVKIVDADALVCTHRGSRTTCLHFTGRHKPWFSRSWITTRGNAYVRLLPRVLFGPAVTLRLPERAVVPWLRTDARGNLLRSLMLVAHVPRTLAREGAKGLIRRLPTRVRSRLLALAGRLAHGR